MMIISAISCLTDAKPHTGPHAGPLIIKQCLHIKQGSTKINISSKSIRNRVKTEYSYFQYLILCISMQILK